jgi:hypothetical protein
VQNIVNVPVQLWLYIFSYVVVRVLPLDILTYSVLCVIFRLFSLVSIAIELLAVE